MISLTNITKDFRDGNTVLHVLKPTTVTFNSHELCAIIGPSGSGKSTLLTIIGALQKPTTGGLVIDGKDVYALAERDRSALRFEKIGFVLQGSNLIPYLTVIEQFQLKLKQARSRDFAFLDTLLQTLDIASLRNKYPDEISGGERQRVAIGLALLLKPKILLADEPTASLDTERANEAVKLLRKVASELGTSVVMVTHDERMLVYCNRVLSMSDGTLSETHS
ncbi:ABC transporter ATP-binding protein [Erysipelothrix sp. HDW6C]|uniref:ABC transporter ATP-binding protein n=1 Tax=Erysipelothrix sp. HDW6C TaxID=2714930 RepID=UPI00140B18BB|nr:ABC transporter ATP-binding protein [Erysipelothrix sp. HDW6C]QIK68781.1 ABC transporter ATP-binding protein [Erysipelothrix sp. HDW6C]